MKLEREFGQPKGAQRKLANPPHTPTERAAPGRECWSVRRVAAYFDVTPKRVYQFIEQGRLEAIRLGPRQIRIPRRSIDDFLAQCGQEPDA